MPFVKKNFMISSIKFTYVGSFFADLVGFNGHSMAHTTQNNQVTGDQKKG
jgi:hypothetical protein